MQIELTHRGELVAVAEVASRGKIKAAGCNSFLYGLCNDALSKLRFVSKTNIIENDVAPLAAIVFMSTKCGTGHNVNVYLTSREAIVRDSLAERCSRKRLPPNEGILPSWIP